jgi:hypothetical protein
MKKMKHCAEEPCTLVFFFFFAVGLAKQQI